MRTPANPQKADISARNFFTALSVFFAPLKILSFVFVISLIFVSIPAYSAVITQTFINRKTGVAGAGMATAGQMAKYVADGSTGEMKMQGVDVATVAISGAYADLTGAPGALSVSDILTGTDTTGKLVSAQNFNAAAGGYAVTTTCASGTAGTNYCAAISGFILQTGAKVRLKIHVANNNNPTLNVSLSGVKSINGISASYLYPGSVADFVYDGTSWIVSGSTMYVADQQYIWNGNAENAARFSGATIKAGILNFAGAVVSTTGPSNAYVITDYTAYSNVSNSLQVGTKVVAKMNVANAAGATLNLNYIGAAQIYYKGAAVAADLLEAGGTYTFVYDGTYWNVVMAPVSISNIISAIGSLSVADILTGTDTTNKLVSAQTINAATGAYAYTSGTIVSSHVAAYTAPISGFVLQTGAKVRLKLHAANAVAPTLDVSGTGVKNILTFLNTPLEVDYFAPNGVADLVYDGTNWIVSGSSMDTGSLNHILMSNASNATRYSGAAIKSGILNFAGAVATTAGTSSAYTVTDTTNYRTSGIIFAGTKIVVKMHVANADNATLDLNSLGPVSIYYKGAAITAGLLELNGVYTLVHDGTYWNVVMAPMPVSNIVSALGALTVPDILTGTDTTGKLISAQNFNAAAGGYATTSTCGGGSIGVNYCASISGFVLQNGAKVRLKMHYSNGSNPKLNINSSGEKYIQIYSGGYVPFSYFYNGAVADFVYDSASDKWFVVGSSMLTGSSDIIRSANTAYYNRFTGSDLKKSMLSYGGNVVSTSGTADAYIISDSTNYTSTGSYLTTGTKVVAKMSVANNANATLNLNSLTAKPIYYKGAAITAGLLELNGVYTFVYEGTSAADASGKWHVVMSPGSGSSAGALTVSEILTGTDTTGKLASAETINAAISGYTTTTTCGGGTTGLNYCAAVSGGFVLQNGARVRLKFHAGDQANATLNVNGTGDKNIQTTEGTNIPGRVFSGQSGYGVGDFVYDSTAQKWIIVGSSIDVGTSDSIRTAAISNNLKFSGDALKSGILYFAGNIVTTTGSSAAYVVTDATNYSNMLTTGTKVVAKIHVANAANATLTVNSLGAYPIYYKGAAITAGLLEANGVYTLVFEHIPQIWNVVMAPGSSGSSPGALSVADILTGTGTTDKLISAQNFNAAMGGYVTTTGTSTAYIAAISGLLSLQNGARIRLKIHSENGATPTLNVNALGAKYIRNSTGAAIAANYFYADGIADFVYDTAWNSWMIIGPAIPQGDADTIRSGDTIRPFQFMGNDLKKAILNYGGAVVTASPVTGPVSAYTITDTTNYTSTAANLNSGTKIVVKIQATNAAGATLSLNGLTAANIYFNGAGIDAGMLQANGIYTFVYDGTNWNVVQSPGVIPITPAQCSDMNARCLLAYGDTDLITAGIQGPGYIWEVVDR